MAYRQTCPQHLGYQIIALLLLVLFAAGCQQSQGPAQFTDSVRFDFEGEKMRVNSFPRPDYVSIVFDRSDQVSFEMTRVPGDAARGIKPFYLSTTEVSAGMFYPWATGEGLAGKEWARWAGMDLRPSRIAEPARLYGPKDRPAMGMSRTVAELYCQWLSRETGRRYRLPTEAEWEHALRLGGGVPANKNQLLRQATLQDNALVQQDPPFFKLPSSVGARQPNALGLYDMLGNAMEWVSADDDQRVARGGHFILEAENLTHQWRWVESEQDWIGSSVYPPDMKPPRYWYHSFYFTGIRLACDADQAPITPKPPDSPEIPAP